ncbi:MAG: FixH family protein [Deltaproteobacteria bacterium]|nr:FixH family protein [Deltaproteobacteria bacterium]
MRPLLLGFSLALVACGGGSGGGADADEAVNCAALEADTFVVGFQKTGQDGVLDFRIMSATPAPPARNDNAWSVQVNAVAGGAPVENATIKVTPFMPAHGHGAGKNALVEPGAEPGRYELSPINLWMPGVWETTVRVTSDAGDDRVVFKFCIPS